MTRDELAAARTHLGWSQERLADALGVSQSIVGLYERDRAHIPMDIAQTVQRLVREHGLCLQCGRKIAVEFWDGRCGACTQPLSEAADA